MLSAGRLRPWVPHGSKEERVWNSGAIAHFTGHSVTNLRAGQGVPATMDSLQQALFIFLFLIQWALVALHAHFSSPSYYEDAMTIISIHREESGV